MFEKLTNQKRTVRIGDFEASWHLPSLLSLFNIEWLRQVYFVFLVLLLRNIGKDSQNAKKVQNT